MKIKLILLLTLNIIFSNSFEDNSRYNYRIRRDLIPERSYDSIIRDETELIDYIESLMESNYIPGISIAIVKDENIVWNRNFGYANIDNNVLVDNNTMFSLASVSKTVTATALMQLWENNLFSLDDDIDDYLPFNINHPDYPEAPITFRMLLTHTSGIKDRWSVMTYYDGDPLLELGYFLEQYLVPGGEFYNPNSCFTNSEPGTNYRYSNIGAGLIGFLVETITGEPFNEYCNENIFQPLGMENSAWFLYELDVNQVAMPYKLIGGSGDSCYEIGCGIYDESNPCFCDFECVYYGDCCNDYEEVCGEDGSGNPDGTITLSEIGHYGYADYPSGQLRCSANDLSKFMTAYISGGIYNDVRILEEDTIEYIKEIQYPDIDSQQGLIWYYKNQDGRYLFGHNGGDLGSITELFISLSNNIGVIVLCNISNYGVVIDIENAIFEFAEETTFQIIGDINYDNELNILDIVLMVNIILNGEYDEIADMNQDDIIDILDVVLIINIIINNQ